MSTHQGVRVNSLAAGTPSPFEHLSGGYYYQRDPTWTPNDPRYRERPPGGPEAPAGVRQGRTAKIARFAAVLRDMGYPDPRRAPASAVRQAGRDVGVGEKTAGRYRAELKRRREGCDDC